MMHPLRAFFLSLLLAISITLVFVSMLHCQQNLPDAPSHLWLKGQSWNYCFHDPGEKKQCLEAGTKDAAHDMALYDRANHPKMTVYVEQRAHFLAARRWSDPPLRSTGEILSSKTFMASHSLLALSILADDAITHHRAGRTFNPKKNYVCTEKNFWDFSAEPTNSQLWRVGGMTYAAGTGIDFILAKYVNLPLSFGYATYGTVIHAQGAYSWKDCQ